MRARNPAPLVTSFLIMLGACTTALPPEETPALGGPFHAAAKDGYVQLAAAQWNAADVPAAEHFGDKARDAMLGNELWPDKVARREVPAVYRPRAIELRERLVTALEAGAVETAPQESAAALVNFDCWLKELAEAPQGEAAAVCREAFLDSLAEVEDALPWPAPFTVFFEEGSDRLDDEARAVVTGAADVAEDVEPGRIDVFGYADLFGPASRNQEISERRARAVANALIGAGVPSAQVNAEGRGEATFSPLQRENRRAEIVFRQ